MRERIYNWLTMRVYFPFCFKVYKGRDTRIDQSSLASMAPLSLGKHLLAFLNKHELNLIGGYELHDIKHALLAYEANFKGEVALQYFELGNGNRSLPVLVVVFFGTLMIPENLKSFIKAFKRGRSAMPLFNENLESRLHLDINLLRKEYKL